MTAMILGIQVKFLGSKSAHDIPQNFEREGIGPVLGSSALHHFPVTHANDAVRVADCTCGSFATSIGGSQKGATFD